MACLSACKSAAFSAFQTQGRTAGVAGRRLGNKKPQALSARIIDVDLQTNLLHSEHFRKILRSP